MHINCQSLHIYNVFFFTCFYSPILEKINFFSDIQNPYHKLDVDLRSMPAFIHSPSGDSDRRVWFSGESFRDQVAPMTPIIDYHNRESDLWEDIEF